MPREPRLPRPPPPGAGEPPGPRETGRPQGREAPAADERPRYTRYRVGPRLFGGGRGDRGPPREQIAADPQPGRRRRWALRGRLTWRRGLAWLALALVGWLALSLALFLISAQTQQASVTDSARRALDSGGPPPLSASTILVLGSDQRTKRTHEPGASTSGPSRSDVILLIRTGGGHSARLSIPRDTVVPIPGHGRAKINAAYAFGGAALTIETVKRYLGISINHLVEVNFDNFPKLIDSMGGVDYSNGCVISRINGGFRNGGYTLRLAPGTTHLSGKQALALARTRHNACHPGESDLTRAKRQQALFAAMRSRLVSPGAFIRLPWISWAAPQALRSDMGGPTLLGVFGGLAFGGSPSTQLLTPSGQLTLPDGGVGLTVSQAERRRAVAQFQNG